MPKLTIFYIADPANYDIMSCTLLASIRQAFGDSVKTIGYCSEHMIDDVHPAVFKAHEIMGGEIRPMKTEGMWDEPYPHGNKIIAALQPRETEYSAFVDTDVLFLRPNSPDNLIRPGHVACSVAASMVWAEQSIWDDVYGAFDMPLPEERVSLMRRGSNVLPYYSSGFVVFPEADGPARRFADMWYETARTIDRVETIPRRRPYLDQLSLPVAILRSGLGWSEIPEEHHYILGGKLRGEPLPQDREIYTVHYRNNNLLSEVGLRKPARQMLNAQTGVRFVRRLVDTPDADRETETEADSQDELE